MENNFESAPAIITGKDLNYLSDMFDWNFIAFKKTKHFINETSNMDIKNIMERCCEIFDTNMNIIMSVVNEGGLDE